VRAAIVLAGRRFPNEKIVAGWILDPLDQESNLSETYLTRLQSRVGIRVAHQGIAAEGISHVELVSSTDRTTPRSVSSTA
jgi:hypothetical protein